MTGTKVEAIHHHGVRALEHFVVGRVLACERHPDADRLSVCEVDLGPARPRGPGDDRVRGAQRGGRTDRGGRAPRGGDARRHEAQAGQAARGGLRGDDPRRGRSSRSARTTTGIMVLDELLARRASSTPGHAARGGAADRDRGARARGHAQPAGLPRASTGSRASCTPPPARRWRPHRGARTPARPGRSRARRCGAVPRPVPALHRARLRGCRVAPSPPWLKARLRAAGQRPINNVVDITNYAMLLTGQPLHAFDLDRVAGARLVVRRARDGEQVQTLDGQTSARSTREMVVIEDADGPTSIAGLMGGARSEVGDATTRVLLEVATWNGPNIHRASWSLGLRSEASARFEKGLAPGAVHARAGARDALDDRAVRRHRRARHDRCRRGRVERARDSRSDDPSARGARAGDPRRARLARAPGARSCRRSTSPRVRPRTGSTSPSRRCAARTSRARPT